MLKLKMLLVAAISFFVAVIFYYLQGPNWFFILSLVGATTFYHLAMRLAVMGVVALFASKVNCDSFWFEHKKWEDKLYKIMGVRAWKNKFPPLTRLDPKAGLAKAIRATCVSEIAHTIIIPLSYAPLALAIIYASKADIVVFALTSAFASFVDFLLVAVHRYNRPRLLALKFCKRKGLVRP